MWQLRNKNNIFSKTEIQLSSTVGQGNTLFSTHSQLFSFSVNDNFDKQENSDWSTKDMLTINMGLG